MPAHTTTLAKPQEQSENTLFVALDLGSTHVQFAMAVRRSSSVRTGSVPARDLGALREAVKRGRKRFGLPDDATVLVCSEAGRDGFWPHRAMVGMGYESIVVDPGSVETAARGRMAKTDRLDAAKLLRALLRWEAGDRHAFHPVRVPSKEAEEARILHRQRGQRVQDRTRFRNRIKSTLALWGIKVQQKELKKLEDLLDHLTTPDGVPLGEPVKRSLRNDLEALRLCERQIDELEREIKEMARKEESEPAKMVTQLAMLRGVGVMSAWILVHELFAWRTFRNRRELASAAGLAPVPRHSDQTRRDLGISKAGNRRVRAVLNQLAWLWVRYQPDSALTQWFQERWGSGSKRQRRVGIVALERKLLIAFWRYVKDGLVPDRARVTVVSAS